MSAEKYLTIYGQGVKVFGVSYKRMTVEERNTLSHGGNEAARARPEPAQSEREKANDTVQGERSAESQTANKHAAYNRGWKEARGVCVCANASKEGVSW